MSSIVASEFGMRPNISVSYGCSEVALAAIEAMEPSREWLYDMQVEAGIESNLGVDVRLAGEIVPLFSLS